MGVSFALYIPIRIMKNSKRILLALILTIFVILPLSYALSSKPGPEGNSKKDDKYYQVVMIWVKDPAKFQKYGELMGPIVSKYGGRGERILTPVSTFYGGETGKSLSQPHMVNIVYYDSKEAYEKFEKDPEFLKIKSMRDESIEMAGIGGTSLAGELIKGGVEDRLYMIEFAYYSDKKGSAYKKYEQGSQGFSQRLGLKKERVLKPDNSFGNIDMPDMVTVKYLEKESDKPNMEKDQDHSKVEELYGAAIRDLIWIEGKAAFTNME